MPQALVYLGAAAEKAGATVKIFDLEAKGWNLPAAIVALAEFEPDLLCISTTSVSFCYARAIADGARDALPNSVVVMGGSHPTYDYRNILASGIADVVVRGEGERALIELIHALREGRDLANIPGIAFVRDGKVRTTGHAIPMGYYEIGIPAYHLIEELDLYRDIWGVTLETSRGCPHGCIFCLNHKMYGPKVREKPFDLLKQEISYLKDNYEIDTFSIVDPTFSLSLRRVIRFCNMARELDLVWACQTRVDLLSEALVRTMADSGCQGILFGIESGTDHTLEIMRKRAKAVQAERAVELARQHGIHVTPSLIMGFPHETRRDIEITIEFAEHLKERYDLDEVIQFNTLAPFPGTDLADGLDRYGISFRPIDRAFYTVVPVIESDQLTYEDHLSCWHRMWQAFFPSYLPYYQEIEGYALAGLNPKLETFCNKRAEEAHSEEVTQDGKHAQEKNRVSQAEA